MREIRRTLRFFDVDIRQHKGRRVWEKVRFEPIARKIQGMPAVEGVADSRYVPVDGERLLMEVRSNQKNEVIGVLWRTVVDGLPVAELGGEFSPLGIAPGGGVSEPCVFGLFENSILVYTLNRRGPPPADFSVYISSIFGGKFKADVIPARLRTFNKILPKIAAFTVLHIRPRFDSMGYIRGKVKRTSLLGILGMLMSRTGQSVAIKISGGRHVHPLDAFEEEFAEFLKEHLKDPNRYSDFEILEGSALLQSGAISPIDITDKHHVEARVTLNLDKDRGLDIADAIRKIKSAYVGKQSQLESRELE